MSGRIAIIVLVVAAVSIGAHCSKHLEDYLRVPAGADLEQPHYKGLLSALTSVMSSEQLSPAQFEKLANQKSGAEKELFGELANLAKVRDAHCSEALVKTYLDIFGLINQSIEDQENQEFASKYSNYLKQYGREKFAACAAEATSKFAQVSVDSSSEEALDQFVSGGSGSSDEELYEVAKAFEGDASHVAPACQEIQKPSVQHLFDIYNLAQVLVKSGSAAHLSSEVPAKFLKLNEYNRICMNA